jgi:phosphorylated adapter RNA export protein
MRAKRRKERQQQVNEQKQVEVARRQEARAFRQTVDQIAEALGEKEKRVVEKIEDIVSNLGTDEAMGFLQETQKIEQQGGMMVPDGSRRRTPGGVFFYLVKQHQKEQKNKTQAAGAGAEQRQAAAT